MIGAVSPNGRAEPIIWTVKQFVSGRCLGAVHTEPIPDAMRPFVIVVTPCGAATVMLEDNQPVMWTLPSQEKAIMSWLKAGSQR